MQMLVSVLAATALLASPPEVRVFAAASLTTVLGTAQQRLAESLHLRFNFAGSQQLALQLSQGAAADVFASADERWMRDVESLALIVPPARVFARNSLAVVTPASNPAHIEKLADLTKPDLKIVLAAEAVPAGRYSREMLAKLGEKGGLGADYRERVLANVVSQEENVEAVVAKVRLSEADAGIVYTTDVAGERGKGLRTIDVPIDSNITASYYVAVLKGAKDRTAAQRFVDWLGSADGRKLLADFGFQPGG